LQRHLPRIVTELLAQSQREGINYTIRIDTTTLTDFIDDWVPVN
jgi:hypothetical protein